MLLEEIFTHWEKDSTIDPIDLGGEALNISKLHNKYLRLLSIERKEARRLESKYKQLVSLKSDWYLGILNGTEELTKLGWEPQRHVVLKADLPRYVDSDKDIIKLVEILGEQKEKVEVLNLIMKEIMTRNWNIRAAIDMLKFNAGAG